MWILLGALALTLVLAAVLKPKPQSVPPAGINDIKAPTASEGREIPVLFGCRKIKSPNIVWWGDFRSVAIKQKGGKK